jgi:DNA-binding GntR family transcriptional regulator
MINRESVVPPWQQLADLLRARIKNGELRPGARIPSAAALAQEYELAPVTVRKAITQLQQEGLLVSRVGWGTYVAEQPPSA